jgi:hypothetical protein
LAWCSLQLLAEWIDKEQPERTALDLFDRLRLREPLARIFAALGFEGEEAWRVAARIKVLLLVSAGIGKAQEAAPAATAEIAATETPAKQVAAPAPQTSAPEASSVLDEKVALAPALWLDPDVRWLCGVHEAEGHFYLIRERYEELLWWLLMPSLLRLAGESAPSRSAVEELSKIVAAALASAEAAGYRIDVLLGPKGAEVISESQQPAQKMKPQPAQEEKRQPAQEMKPQPAQRKKPRKKRARKPGK